MDLETPQTPTDDDSRISTSDPPNQKKIYRDKNKTRTGPPLQHTPLPHQPLLTAATEVRDLITELTEIMEQTTQTDNNVTGSLCERYINDSDSGLPKSSANITFRQQNPNIPSTNDESASAEQFEIVLACDGTTWRKR